MMFECQIIPFHGRRIPKARELKRWLPIINNSGLCAQRVQRYRTWRFVI